MKKYLCLSLMILLSLVVLVGCGGNQSTTSDESNAQADVVTTASTVNDEAGFKKAIGKDGTWIIVTLNDLTFDEELVVEGEFRDKDIATNDLYRKLAPYTQDASHKVQDRYTITAPKLTIKSPNTKLQGGTFIGDIYVQANGFIIQDAKVEGNVYFANEEYKSSFDMSNAGVVTGVTEVNADADAVSSASTTE